MLAKIKNWWASLSPATQLYIKTMLATLWWVIVLLYFSCLILVLAGCKQYFEANGENSKIDQGAYTTIPMTNPSVMKP